ncbi:MAG: phosphoribosylglycinamide formyltransferase [Hyphomicrobiales bacterium]|nr:phosphoribosylglycinamide formyltransferase [Hyphomicrobiales bacterium]
MSSAKRIGVLISGRGSNMAALIEACKAPDYPAEIAIVISNRPGAPGLEMAAEAGIPAATIDHTAYPSREAFEAETDKALREAKVDLICNAGFMRLLTESFVDQWRNRQLNIHPSLLPAFKGLNTHERALEAGVRIAGCTVHFVRSEMDSGPIIAQAAVPVLPGDTPDTLAARVLKAEHELYPLALKLVASGAAQVQGERVIFADDSVAATALFAPQTA